MRIERFRRDQMPVHGAPVRAKVPQVHQPAHAGLTAERQENQMELTEPPGELPTSAGAAPGDHTPHIHKVEVTVDTKPRHLDPGSYEVSAFKELVKVPADKELDELLNGALTPLADTAAVTIRGGEQFFSHVRRGGSS
jgi:hypothetical protein